MLWIVATPLGNSEDLSPRAAKIIESADLVLAEDTRKAADLLHRRGLARRPMLSFFEHNEKEREAEILEALEKGLSVALMTDAGTPLISDPGYNLVRACRREGYKVSPVPGPSAPMGAICAAGISPLPFTFLGFPPRGKKNRSDLFKKFAEVPGSLCFFERKDRLCETLELAYLELGPRELAICRELTKPHEEFILGRLENFADLCSGLLGEITVLIGPPEQVERTAEAVVAELLTARKKAGMKGRKASQEVRQHSKGWSTRELYELFAHLEV